MGIYGNPKVKCSKPWRKCIANSKVDCGSPEGNLWQILELDETIHEQNIRQILRWNETVHQGDVWQIPKLNAASHKGTVWQIPTWHAAKPEGKVWQITTTAKRMMMIISISMSLTLGYVWFPFHWICQWAIPCYEINFHADPQWLGFNSVEPDARLCLISISLILTVSTK